MPSDPAPYRRGPAWMIAAGALTMSVSPVMLDLSGASPGTATFFRCALAVPVLALPAVPEWRREGPPPGRRYKTAALAGVLFAGDALLWTQAIAEVGAGLSTVLVNAQVVLVPLLAWVVDREPVSRVFLRWLPVLTVGVVLTGGVVEGGASGDDPAWGTVHAVLAALCYAGFLFLLRRGGQGGQVVQTYTVVILCTALTALPAGALWYGIDLTPSAPALAWLAGVGLTSQVVGYQLVALASPRLPGHTAATLLLLMPVATLALGAIVLGERPSPLQLTGCALILLGAYVITAREPRRPRKGDADRSREAVIHPTRSSS